MINLFKILMITCSITFLFKTIIEDNTQKAYCHLFDATLTMALGFFVKGII